MGSCSSCVFVIVISVWIMHIIITNMNVQDLFEDIDTDGSVRQ